jgi:tungstate transport system permease protein
MSGSPFTEALRLLGSLDSRVVDVVLLSLWVSTIAVALAVALALPAALALGLARFRGRRVVRGLVRALMMVPAVLVGLLLYLLLGRSGPLGPLELLYTPWAIVIAQGLLAWPLVTALFLAAVEGVDPVLIDAARTAGAGPLRLARAAARQAAPALFAAGLTGLARVIGETGMTMMVGGNIVGQTRTMTTAIATETMRGEFETAIALGIVLLAVSVAVNLGLLLLEPRSDARAR